MILCISIEMLVFQIFLFQVTKINSKFVTFDEPFLFDSSMINQIDNIVQILLH